MAERKTITGYRDKLSVQPGDKIDFKISSFDEKSYDADLVRIISGNTANRYSGLDLEKISAPFAKRYDGRRQNTCCGSYALVDTATKPIVLNSFSMVCAVKPTTEGRDEAVLINLSDPEFKVRVRLSLTPDRKLKFQIKTTDSTSEFDRQLQRKLPFNNWSIVGVSYDSATNSLTIFQTPYTRDDFDYPAGTDGLTETNVPQFPSLSISSITMAAELRDSRKTTNHFTGRLDSVRLLSSAYSKDAMIDLVQKTNPQNLPEVQGFWDFSADVGGATFSDLSKFTRHGVLKNLPTRAVRGVRWNGEEHRWTHAPNHYSAIHFCEYDIYDCEWETDFTYTVPLDLRSGIYAVRLQKGDEIEYITFFVTPSLQQEKSRIAFLASTATYLAYANDINAILMAPLLGGEDAVMPEEEMLVAHPEFGRSLYHQNVDGFGIHFSSYLRPTATIRPDTRAWSLCADFDITHWLERTGFEFDVITDEQLHNDGVKLLEAYSVVITGTHPEYYSQRMRDGIEGFVLNGGRLMYMGGNGFYWKVAHSDAWPAAIELRRAEDGSRAWVSQPGEYYQQFDGQLGGLWRRQDQPPQKLVGVGFASQGNPGSMRFRRTPEADNPRVSFAFDGISEDIICDFGKMKASAMAEETDRVDYSLGTPAHTLVLASTENAPPNLLRTKEELNLFLPQIVDQDVKADVTFFEVEGGGAVFSTGSIAWSSVLAFENFQNPTAKLTTNILRRFVDPTEFTPPEISSVSLEEMIPQLYQLPAGLRVGKLSYATLIKESFSKALMIFALPILLKWKKIRMPTPAPPRDSVVHDRSQN